jgi:hypothetical protein
MNDVNWWLMALAFVLGLALTLAFMIRRVVREVPVYGAAGASAAANLVGTTPKATEADVDLPDAELPKASASGTGAAAAGAAGLAGAAKLVGSRGSGAGDEKPYGAGSLRLAAGADAPAGYTVKANEDSMQYHTTDSPSYAQTIAELWFTEESAAKKAGFTRWDAAGDAATTKLVGARGGAAGDAATTKLVGAQGGDAGEEPYGAGSLRLATGSADAPAGYTIKGNEDSMLYHTPDSPSYKQTIAEVWFREEDAAERAGFARWDKGRKAAGAATLAATEPEVPPGPHGPGSATPGSGGSGPAGWTIKGNEDSKLYHSPESPSYEVTIAEVWFRDAATAEAAGFNRWDSGKSQRGQN